MPQYELPEHEKSVAQRVAELPEAERKLVLEGFVPESLLWDWSFWGRPKQFAPEGDWNIWLIMAGRGFGKTRTAAEWVRQEAKTRMPDGSIKRFAFVGRIFKDVRDTMITGSSGVIEISPPSERPNYEPSKSRLTWPNGNIAQLYTADEPNQLRGPSFTHAWGDEIAAWRRLPDDSGLTAWDNLRIATRDGDHPRIILTTTPKRVPLMLSLVKEAEEKPKKVKITKGSTYDNMGNLHEDYIDSMTGTYEGTTIGAQELFGELLDDVEGILWSPENIQDFSTTNFPDAAPLRIVGVDPSVAENPKDHCGIVVLASTNEPKLYQRHAWVLEDATIKGPPDVWAKQVVETARRWGAPVVAETNQGGALVKNAIHQIDPDIKVYEVHSKVGKKLRAEPVALAYQQGRVHHVVRAQSLAELEGQMTIWQPGVGDSPDRIDALVHGLTALLISPPQGFGGGRITAKSPAAHRLPSTSIVPSVGGSRGGRIVNPSAGGIQRVSPRRHRPGGFSVR